MTAIQLIGELSLMNPFAEVYAKNDKGLYRRVEKVEMDDNYPDVMIYAGDVE